MKNKPAYAQLLNHSKRLKKTNLSKLFEKAPERAENFSLKVNQLYLDYSKNTVDEETITALIAFARQQKIEKKIKDLFSGKSVNLSEKRPALHTVLRTKQNTNLIVNGDNISEQIESCKRAMFAFEKKINAGKLKGCTGKPIKHFVVLGIGGSYLGPKFVIDALKPFHQHKTSVHFIANLDESALFQTLKPLALDECLFFIASKSFTTLETLTNAKTIVRLFSDKGFQQFSVAKHFIAATSNTKAALDFGIDKNHIFPLWDWVGGRFSLWSSIGLPILISLGKKNFSDLLDGAFKIDTHFQDSELRYNMPVLLALLTFWYQQFFSSNNQAIIPYAHNLKTFPAFLQQLDMESLGKSVSANSHGLDYPTGSIIWGSEGCNSQHSFHQLLHQGTHFIPIDFIVSLQPDYPQNKTHHMLYTQCLAQSRALMLGNHSQSKQQHCAGNKPSNTLVLDAINPNSIGALIALYEHKVYVLSVLLEVNAFDQWGVEVGKTISRELESAFEQGELNNFDPSTNKLLSRLNNAD